MSTIDKHNEGAAPPSEKVPPLLILGVGNILLTDEGAGVHAIQELQRRSLPENVEIIDGGTMGLELMWLMENRQKIILIDAVQTHEPPGTIFRFTPNDIGKISGGRQVSFHQLGFLDTLKVARYLGKEPPEIIIVGIQPKSIEMGMELTPEIKARLPQLLECVMKEVGVA